MLGYIDSSTSRLLFVRLRSSKAPDEEADMGSHEFSYAVLPHSGKTIIINLAAPWPRLSFLLISFLFNEEARELKQQRRQR